MIANMNDQNIGRSIRAMRRRRAWRQTDLAATAGCSQNLISLVERGHLDTMSVRVLRRILAALDASAYIQLLWRGAALDRLLDEDHAAIVGAVAELLRSLDWLVEVEVTYAHFGERGSFDILALMPGAGTLLVIEVKTDMPSVEATLRKLDEKVRLAPTASRDRLGWTGKHVSRLLVMPESSTLRRRVDRHAAIFDRSLPQRAVAVRRWLAEPAGTLAGLWFLSPKTSGVARSRTGGRERLRPRRVPSPNPGIAA